MVIAQGDVWWADIREPIGSEPGYCLPVVVVQGDQLNASNIAIAAFDKGILTERVSRLPLAKLNLILAGIDVVLGRGAR